jgi:hypothetical protein
VYGRFAEVPSTRAETDLWGGTTRIMMDVEKRDVGDLTGTVDPLTSPGSVGTARGVHGDRMVPWPVR